VKIGDTRLPKKAAAVTLGLQPRAAQIRSDTATALLGRNQTSGNHYSLLLTLLEYWALPHWRHDVELDAIAVDRLGDHALVWASRASTFRSGRKGSGLGASLSDQSAQRQRLRRVRTFRCSYFGAGSLPAVPPLRPLATFRHVSPRSSCLRSRVEFVDMAAPSIFQPT